MDVNAGKIRVQMVVCLLIILLTVPYSTSTIVQKCSSGAGDNTEIDNQVFISGCYKPPCTLQRNSSITVEILFAPEYDVSRLQANVYAWIYAIPLPYLGVDGKSACNNLYYKDGGKASCPIRRGQQYLYKNTIEVKSTYPKAKVVLHWALLDTRNNANVFCFEVPVKIINHK